MVSSTPAVTSAGSRLPPRPAGSRWRRSPSRASSSPQTGRSPAGTATPSTHDTKRGEDIRARLAVLAEMPDAWGGTARRLMSLRPIPNAAFGYLLWQTAVATPALPVLQTPAQTDPTALLESVPDPRRDRFQAYAEQAMREADVETGWINQDKTFETAVYVAVSRHYWSDRRGGVLMGR